MEEILGIFFVIYIISIICIYLFKFSISKYFIGTIIPIVIGITFIFAKNDTNTFKVITASIIGLIVNISLINNKIKARSLFKTTFVMLLFFFTTIIQLLFFKLLGMKKPISDSDTVLLTFLADLIITFILLIIYQKDIKDGFKKLKENIYEFFDNSFKYWLIGLALMIFTNLIISIFFKQAVPNNENTVQNLLKENPLLLGICTSILAPIMEELIFRKSLHDVIPNKVFYVIISGLIFGGIHVVFSYKSLYDFLYIIPYGLLGATFAYGYTKTNNILSPIFMHFLHNSSLTILSILAGIIII